MEQNFVPSFFVYNIQKLFEYQKKIANQVEII